MGDIWIARIGVVLLGVVALAGLVAGAIISIDGHDIPPFLAGISTSAVSTLGVVVIALMRPPQKPEP